MTPSFDYDVAMTPAESGPSTILPGITAGAHLWTRTKLYPFIFIAGAGVALTPFVSTILMVGCFIILAASLVQFFRTGMATARLENAEIALGYTTMGMTAYQQPGLWFLHHKTKEVVSAPFQPRPQNTRKATMEAWMKERRSHSQNGPAPTS